MIFTIGIALFLIANFLLLYRAFNGEIYIDRYPFYMIYTVLILLSLSTALPFFIKYYRQYIVVFLLGPLLAFSFISQSSLFADRDPVMRQLLTSQNVLELSKSNQIDFLILKMMNLIQA